MYRDFAEFYDLLTDDVDYAARTEQLLSLFRQYDRIPTLLLDLACGTGGFANEFAAKGISVIGVDRSAEMLSHAAENTRKKGQSVLYLCQDAAELDLYGTVDGAVCCLDSLNHLTDYETFCHAIGRVSLFLEEDRLFIFDLNTVYKHEKVLGNNVFLREENGLYCVWENHYDAENRLTQMELDFFEEQPDGSYRRFSDSVTERVYTREEIVAALEKNHLALETCLEELTLRPPTAETQRIIYVARKKAVAAD
ncbi:MAG: class I SAM-dependent methyltransferase [Clostridia bacterium]|nr:class I SAM-dependent methyltransferase [Clostridia bacterium]